MKQSVASCSEYCFSPSYKLHKTQIESSRPIPLVDAFPLDIWLYKEPEELQGSATAPADKKTPSCDDQQEQQRAKMHLLVQIETIVNVQINHYQLLFLMRFLETLGEITCFLTQVLLALSIRGMIGKYPVIFPKEYLPQVSQLKSLNFCKIVSLKRPHSRVC